MTKHTPAPWVVDEDPTQDGDHLTMITTPGKAGFMGTWIAGCIHNWNDAAKDERRISWAEAEANARLIAAAPELLTELIALRRRFHSCCAAQGSSPEYVALSTPGADAVIAKALGK